MKISAIIPASGSGTRYNPGKNKLLEDLNGIPVINRTLQIISEIKEITEIVVCSSLEFKGYKVVPGGKTRQESVFNGLKALDNPDFVLIHDGARPLITQEIIRNAINQAVAKGSAVVAVPAKDTIKRVNPTSLEVIETFNREELWNIQTPQIFRYNDILKAHKALEGQNYTDDAALMEKTGHKVFITMGSYKNIKITTEEDLGIAKYLLSQG